MGLSKLNFTSALLSFIAFYFISLTPSLKAQVDPSAYANGIKAIVVISPKGELKALKMAPPKFKAQRDQIVVKLSVKNNRLKMVPLGYGLPDSLLRIYIKQPIALSPNVAKALKISNPNEAKLRKGMITINNRRKMLDVPTMAPLKAVKR